MFNKIKKFFMDSRMSTTTIRHFVCYFLTVDGEKHSYSKFRYIDEDAIRCSGPEYIMMDIRSDGYIKDDNGIMYPLQNILSISWKCDDEIKDVYASEYKIFYDKNSKRKENNT